MAATFGRIKEFCPDTNSMKIYLEEVEAYFKANKVKDDQKAMILLSSIGSPTFTKLSDLLCPDSPLTKTYAEITEALLRHCEPRRVEVAERYAFYERRQQAGETIADYDAAKRKLATHCGFGAFLTHALRDAFVFGLREQKLRQQLLGIDDLTYAKALDLAQASETAARKSKEMQAGSTGPTVAVQRLNRQPSTPRQRSRQPTTTPRIDQCYRCGGKHKAAECKFKDAICHYCKKPGHLARVCRSKARQGKQPRTSEQKTNCLTTDDDDSVADIYHVEEKNKPPYVVNLSLNDAPLQMELDTGAALSLISESTYKKLWKVPPKLKPTTTRLRTYSGHPLTVLGTIQVKVNYEKQQVVESLLVVKGSGPSLFGRDWLGDIKLNWQALPIHYSTDYRPLNAVLSKHEALFRQELGKAKSIEAKLHLEHNATPRFCGARSVPYALKEKVEKELERLEKDDVIEPVQFSDWAAPIVPVTKPDGSVRICGDYKLTVNQAAQVESYPLPKIEDLFAKLAGGKYFTKLDIAHAYQQIPLDENSKPCVTINTHKGLFRYKRLPFGVHSAPAIFQRAMEGLLRDIPSTVVYIDDILITGKTEEEHLRNLDEVLTRLEKEGLTLKKEKCQFLLEVVEYLGHTISAKGLQPSEKKTKAIAQAPPPQNISQLRSFLGMVNYYGKFLKHLSSHLAPLYRLLQKKSKWKWGSDETKAFNLVKSQLSEAPVLEHYDPTKLLSLATDASPYGIGAVLSHVLEDGTEKPVAFASRTLNVAEKKYSQLDKEALAIIFGVKRFHHYLYGRKFSIVSDHKPLQYLLNESRHVPVMASARLQRWALLLSAYQYSISYRPGEKLANADGLSRLPLPEAPSEVSVPDEVVFLLQTLQSSPITADQIKKWTNRDPILSRVRNFVSKGWNDSCEDELSPYRQRKDELSMLDGCVLWGNRVIVPTAGRKEVMCLLHDGHPGITKMKSLARQVVWWPGLDADLTTHVQACQLCQLNQKSPTTAPLHPWEWPKKPWSRVHVDHLGPFQGKTILIVVDAHSKWIEAVPVPSTSSHATVKVLRNLFATHGIPELLFSDNGTAFTSEEFKQFVTKNGIRHRTSAPYHPATNGLAERAVQVVKAGLRKNSEGDIDLRLARILFKYRNTPHSTTGVTPAELLLGRKPRTHLDLLHPDMASHVAKKQNEQKKAHDKRQPERSFKVNDLVIVRNFQHGNKWLQGKISKVLGPRSYLVALDNGKNVRRHVDHIRIRIVSEDPQFSESILPPEERLIESRDTDVSESPPEPEQSTVSLRRSDRPKQPPNRYSHGLRFLGGRNCHIFNC